MIRPAVACRHMLLLVAVSLWILAAGCILSTLRALGSLRSLARCACNTRFDQDSFNLIWYDFEANGRLCSLFESFTRPPRTRPESRFTQFSSILRPTAEFAYFSRFQIGRPGPSRMHDFTRIHAILSEFEVNFAYFLGDSAWLPRTPPECMILAGFI